MVPLLGIEPSLRVAAMLPPGSGMYERAAGRARFIVVNYSLFIVPPSPCRWSPL